MLFAVTNPMAQLLNERDAARPLALSVRTLQNWRLLRQGPRDLKLGQAVRYDPGDLEAFVQAAPRTSTSERSSGQAEKPRRV